MCSREDLDRVALAQLHDRLLPARPLPAVRTTALRLRLHHQDVHPLDLDVEQLLDRLPDLCLVRVWMDVEAVLPLLDAAVGLLGHDGSEQHLVGMQTHRFASIPWRPPALPPPPPPPPRAPPAAAPR